MLLIVACRDCDRVARFLASDVAHFVDPARSLEDLPFRCRACGERNCAVEARDYDLDRRPKIIVWRPTRLW